MKEINTINSLALTFFIIIVTILISLNNRIINSTIITIEKGMSLSAVSELLYEKNVIVNQDVFKAKAILRGLASKVPTGKFLVEGKVSDKVLIDLIFKKGPIKLKLMIPEGLQSDQLFKNINTLLKTDYDFKKYFSSEEIIQDFNIEGQTLEGYLYPDTYYLYHDSSPAEIIDILITEFWKQFDKSPRAKHQ